MNYPPPRWERAAFTVCLILIFAILIVIGMRGCVEARGQDNSNYILWDDITDSIPTSVMLSTTVAFGLEAKEQLDRIESKLDRLLEMMEK